MAFTDLVKQRKSVRKYTERTLERDKVINCIEAARLAPSAENSQPWRFIVIDEHHYKNRFCTTVTRGIYRPTRFIRNAPVIVVILARLDIVANRLGKAVQGTSYYLLDTGIAGEHLVLQAQEQGIGTCWIGWFNAGRAKKFLKVGRSYRVVSLIAMGYPAAGSTKNRPRHSLDKIMCFNQEAEKKF
ncbi:MAG: nitroreductase family protein [Spirochaetota bacterium]